MDLLKSWYYSLFNFLTTGVKFSHFEAVQEVHRFVFATLLTSIIMWSYALNTYLSFESTLIALIGFATAFFHLLSLFVYRLTKSSTVATHFFLAMGCTFQVSYSYFTGGFFSSTLIWVSILPLIAGIILGKRGLITWFIISLSCVFTLLYLGHKPNFQNELGQIWGQLNITIGYVALNSILIFIFIHLEDNQREKIKNQNESIKKLLRVVGHDIANPLTISVTSTDLLRRMIEKGESTEKILKFVDRISKSSKMITEILDNTRNLEILSTEKRTFQLEAIHLNEIIDNSIFIFDHKIKHKNITIDYNFDQNKNIKFKAEKVSIKNEVFNNLFSNAIKFMDYGGKLTITAFDLKTEVHVSIRDTGLGMDEKTQKNLFCSDVKTTTLGTQGEKGTGFGMPILFSTLQEIGATIEVNSTTADADPVNHGTEFIIKFRK